LRLKFSQIVRHNAGSAAEISFELIFLFFTIAAEPIVVRAIVTVIIVEIVSSKVTPSTSI
jgi:hypothetical protein